MMADDEFLSFRISHLVPGIGGEGRAGGESGKDDGVGEDRAAEAGGEGVERPIRKELHRRLDSFDAVHLRHAMVYDEHCHSVIALLEAP